MDFFKNVLIFPNPVKRGYSGLITISGLSDNTNVKITDVSGNLVFETTTEGGGATWDGRSFSGKKVQTGVYLFFCTNSLFNESIIKKVLSFIRSHINEKRQSKENHQTIRNINRRVQK